MNRIMQNDYHILEETTALRTQMMDILTDADLAFKFDNNPTLGELCKELGDFEQVYIDSFKTFKMDWSYKHPDTSLAQHVDKLKAWYQQLDNDLKAALTALSDDDINNKTVDRGGFQPPVGVQFHVYRECLLIFYAKASVYLRAMGKTVPEQWRYWIG